MRSRTPAISLVVLEPARHWLVGVAAALVVVTVASVAEGNSQGPTDQQPGADPCGSEIHLARSLHKDPVLAKIRAGREVLVQQAARVRRPPSVEGRQSSTESPLYTIPVAVHVVHQGGAENISDAQVLSQIDALNRDFANAGTQIQFCLAQNLPPGSPVTWSTTPGITRATSPQTTHTFGDGASEAALKAIDYLPAEQYLNIWVVRDILGGPGTIAGYATFPGSVQRQLDGIVMWRRTFGSNHVGPTFSDLRPAYDDGKVLTHEVGHFLDLFHTFHGGCSAPGDEVDDTPPERANNFGCPSVVPLSCFTSPDPIQNFMDYTNDSCRFFFSAGQTARQHAALGEYRSQLTSAANLIAVGCSSGLNAQIATSATQVCTNDAVGFSTSASGAGFTYAWTFTGGVPATASARTASAQFAAPGPHTVTLTVTDGGSHFSTNTVTIYATECTPITGACSNWVFTDSCRLDFSSGIPTAIDGAQNAGPHEAATQISDGAGNLLFYSNGETVWGKNDQIMPNGTGIIGGKSSHKGALIVPRPGSSTQYFLFTVAQQENGLVTDPLRVTTVDMSLAGGNGDVVAAEKNLPVHLPGAPRILLEGQTAVRHCNGTDWWHIARGAYGGAAAGDWSKNLYVTLVTAAGPTTSSTYALDTGNTDSSPGSIVASGDGSRLAVVHSPGSQDSQAIQIYDFDRATGVATLALDTGPIGASQDIAFSPSGTILYFRYRDSTVPGSASEVRQLDIASSRVRTIRRDFPSYTSGDLVLGPDGKLYIGKAVAERISVINFPDNFNTLDANECGYVPDAISLDSETTRHWMGGIGTLPNTLPMCAASQPARFTYTANDCRTVHFHAVNCSASYGWTFGDGTTGAGKDVTHSYAGPGTYEVKLTVAGANPTTVTVPIVLAAQPVAVAGPSDACRAPSNYSTNGPPSYSYAWTVSGGVPATATGRDVDVSWGGSGGTVSVLATDPRTGCTSTATRSVATCTPCVAGVHNHPGKTGKFVVSFVRAFDPCIATTPMHEPPWSPQACAAAATWPQLSFGPDGDGTAAFAARVRSGCGQDMLIFASFGDVRNGSDGSGTKFDGTLFLTLPLRVTDRLCSAERCTVMDVTLDVTMSCSNGDCQLSTTLDTLYPGIATPCQEVNLEIGQPSVRVASGHRVFEGGLYVP